jgi:putative protease
VELLAPAGNIDCFYAAIQAGANALYLGLDAFNARLRARNFTTKTLSYLLPQAHARGVRVYVTLNTLIKQQELRRLIDLLYQLSQLGVDALIVADFGVIGIARRYFPQLHLHGSTQMFLHNAPALAMAAELGLTRVIAPRELTLEEITALKAQSPVELELFAHGALCYSFSGQCLASSYLGGGSGNRGLCTQVCRRSFSTEDQASGHFFSPRDLQTIELIPRFKQIGIAALKIEGRMRSPEYVRAVVGAYRAAIDDPARTPQLLGDLAFDMGRPKTTFFLTGIHQEGTIDSRSTGTGVYLGDIGSVDGAAIGLPATDAVSAGDTVRIHPADGFEGVSAKVSSVVHTAGCTTLALTGQIHFATGDTVYLTSRRSARSGVTPPPRKKVKPVRFNQSYPNTRQILAERSRATNTIDKGQQSFVKIDDIRWLPLLQERPWDGLIAALEPGPLEKLLVDRCLGGQWANRLIACLPPFIAPADVKLWSRIIHLSHGASLVGWMCGHASQRRLLPRRAVAWADHNVWTLNRHSENGLNALGFSRFCYPMEDDFPNLRAHATADGLVYVYTHVPLFVSRVTPALPDGDYLTDSHDHRFLYTERNGLHWLRSDSPLCLFQRMGRLREIGLRGFIIDLSGMTVDKAELDRIVFAYDREERLAGSTLFNFKLGLH